MRFPEVYNQDLQRTAILQNAFDIGYELKFNELSTAHFSLPLDDPKAEYCKPYHFVEIFDGDERVDIFRIVPTGITKDDSGKIIEFSLEHVLGTLIDDVLFRYHQRDNMTTEQNIEYILDKQETKHWELGQLDFERYFSYNWENENLLAALFSIPKPFTDEYQWTTDTTTYPWKINLVEPSDKVKSYIFYKKNMKGIEKEEDPTEMATRLYPLGYGEGVNQLGIEDVNPSGQPYIDADTIPNYGVISRVWVDRRCEDAESLYESAKSMLQRIKRPRVSYDVSAIELFQKTGEGIDKFVPGDMCRVEDEDLGSFKTRIVSIDRPDVMGQPGDISVQITNEPEDLASSIRDLADRTKINETYAQGATNMDSYSDSDNCDPDNPLKIRFHIAREAVNINKAILSYESGPFRAYSRAIKGGGAVKTSTEDGGGFFTSTKDGGGFFTSTSDGGYTSDTTAFDGEVSKTETASAGGSYEETKTSSVGGDDEFETRTDQTTWHVAQSDGKDPMRTDGGHNHGISDGTDLRTADDSTVSFQESGRHAHVLNSHSHNIQLPGHRHDVSIDIPSHNHDVSIDIPSHRHSFEVPEHDHNLNVDHHSHSIEVDDHDHDIELAHHKHEIEYGIFEGPRPDNIVVRVDGNKVPDTGTGEDELDILDYLEKDNDGKIKRGWHEVEFKPDDLARINATLHIQLFIQSRGEARL